MTEDIKKIIERAVKELNDEGLLKGTRITEEGKREVENILKSDGKAQEFVFNIFIKKLENDFYETDFLDFCLKVLKLEEIMRKVNINFYEKILKMKS